MVWHGARLSAIVNSTKTAVIYWLCVVILSRALGTPRWVRNRCSSSNSAGRLHGGGAPTSTYLALAGPGPPGWCPPTVIPGPAPPLPVPTLCAVARAAALEASSIRLLTSSMARVAASMARASCSANARSWAPPSNDIGPRSSSVINTSHKPTSDPLHN